MRKGLVYKLLFLYAQTISLNKNGAKAHSFLVIPWTLTAAFTRSLRWTGLLYPLMAERRSPINMSARDSLRKI
jgi:hypothetical protein